MLRVDFPQETGEGRQTRKVGAIQACHCSIFIDAHRSALALLSVLDVEKNQLGKSVGGVLSI